jgi:hypothetical protein
MTTNLIRQLLSRASFEAPGRLKIEGPAIIVLPAVIAIVFCSITSLLWVYKDAVKRNKNGLIALLFIILTGWPVSFLWWFWLRPPLRRNEQSQPR